MMMNNDKDNDVSNISSKNLNKYYTKRQKKKTKKKKTTTNKPPFYPLFLHVHLGLWTRNIKNETLFSVITTKWMYILYCNILIVITIFFIQCRTMKIPIVLGIIVVILTSDFVVCKPVVREKVSNNIYFLIWKRGSSFIARIF